jgi:hypothetical protein
MPRAVSPTASLRPARAFGQRMRDRGKAEMVILCAFMRKLLHIGFGVLKNQKPYEPSFHAHA